jgi:hypothetical protein
MPRLVFEVKAAINSRREFHQAAGQARAYAQALNCRAAFVVAPHVKEELLGSTAFGVFLTSSKICEDFFRGKLVSADGEPIHPEPLGRATVSQERWR